MQVSVRFFRSQSYRFCEVRYSLVIVAYIHLGEAPPLVSIPVLRLVLYRFIILTNGTLVIPLPPEQYMTSSVVCLGEVRLCSQSPVVFLKGSVIIALVKIDPTSTVIGRR